MDTEESVMRIFKANKMKVFFTYQVVTLWNLLLWDFLDAKRIKQMKQRPLAKAIKH